MARNSIDTPAEDYVSVGNEQGLHVRKLHFGKELLMYEKQLKIYSLSKG